MLNDHEHRQLMRREMGEKRGLLTAGQVQDHSRAIAARLQDLHPFVQATAIMGFAGIGNEVDLTAALQKWAESRTVLLPRVEKNGQLAAVKFEGWEQTRSGVFGIREPGGSPVNPSTIDMVIVPGLVFDGKGYRLGYGKGYYDRFLKLLPARTFVCGVCYDFQVVDTVWPHESDVPMHWIVTEKSELAINWDFF